MRGAVTARARQRVFLETLSAKHQTERARSRSGELDPLVVLGVNRDAQTFVKLLAWWMSPESEHGLGERTARRVCALAGVSDGVLNERYRVGCDNGVVWLKTRSRTVGVTLEGGEGTLPEGVGAESVWSIERDALARELEGFLPEVSSVTGWFIGAWVNALRQRKLERMNDWKGFGADSGFLLDHWREYQDLVAVKETLDREFSELRMVVTETVRTRWPEGDGWVCTLDEDWILLRRRDWPVPAEEWLAYVVVLTDIDSVLTEGRDGWWSGLSLPTDGDFDGEKFTARLRAKIDPVYWHEWLAQSWPGHAVGRPLPRVLSGVHLREAVETAVCDELQRLVELTPVVEQCLRELR